MNARTRGLCSGVGAQVRPVFGVIMLITVLNSLLCLMDLGSCLVETIVCIASPMCMYPID